jgi:hypothetical protein
MKDDEILRQGHANYLTAVEGVGGRLFLTDRRLYFKPHIFNRNTEDASISLDQRDRGRGCHKKGPPEADKSSNTWGYGRLTRLNYGG